MRTTNPTQPQRSTRGGWAAPLLARQMILMLTDLTLLLAKEEQNITVDKTTLKEAWGTIRERRRPLATDSSVDR